jgi:hypothetical protein
MIASTPGTVKPDDPALAADPIAMPAAAGGVFRLGFAIATWYSEAVIQAPFAAVCGVAFLLLAAAPAAAGRVPCTSVIGALDRLDDSDGRAPEAESVARALGTDPAWVERCAQVYGRKVIAPPAGEDFGREDRAERWEEEEAEELSVEEKQARGDVYPGHAEDEKRRPRKFGEDAHEWEPNLQKPWNLEMHEGWQPTLLDDDL